MEKSEYKSIIKKVREFRSSILFPFFDEKKFIQSMLFHNLALYAVRHLAVHSDTTIMNEFFAEFKFKQSDYLKAVKWFECRSGKGLMIEDGVIKLDRKAKVVESYITFGEFLRTYNGNLPEIVNSAQYKAKLECEEVAIECRDEDDLIVSPLRIGGRMALGGYGTGKKR